MFLYFTAEATYFDQNHCFVDETFAVHPDTKNHMGVYMIFEKGMVDGSAKTQKINITSLTETEVVAMYKHMPAIM